MTTIRTTRNVRATLVLLFLVLLTSLTLQIRRAYAEEVHHLAFASDYHGTEGSIERAFGGMPADVEYVGLVGDMVGDSHDMYPAYDSSLLLRLVRDVFPGLGPESVSIIWASHDRNVRDDAGIVRCAGGTGSGPIFQGTYDDGRAAYQVYAIAFGDMCAGGTQSEAAAAAFKAWADTVDETVPIIVCCHVPLQARRGDNLGATYWSEALNYAACGLEGLGGTSGDATIRRNVVFLHGHNHSVDDTEYHFGPGAVMSVQKDTSADASSQAGTEVRPTPPAEGGTRPAPPSGGEGGTRPRPPHRRAEGVDTIVYYTSLTCGYLKTNATATLIGVSDAAITLQRHSEGRTVSIGQDGSGVSSPTLVTIPQFRRSHVLVHDAIRIDATDGQGHALPATFALTDEAGTTIARASGTRPAFSTQDPSLSHILPEPGQTTRLTLVEDEAPEGFEPTRTRLPVTITATATLELRDHEYVETVTFEMLVDGRESVSLTYSPTAPATSGTGGYFLGEDVPFYRSYGGSGSHSLPYEGDAREATHASLETVRLAGPDRLGTAERIVQEGFGESAYAVVATAWGHADALAASSVAGALHAPVVLTAQDHLSPEAARELQRLRVSHVLLMGGTAAVSAATEQEIAALDIDVVRIAGTDRFATCARALAETLDRTPTADTLIVVRGTDFADALSAGPFAYATASPIALTGPDGRLTDALVDAVHQRGQIRSVLLVGGTSAVSEDVRDQLGDGYDYLRLSGDDRYATSAAVARFCLARGLAADGACLATGRNFPDALAGAAFAGTRGTILLLADDPSDATMSLIRERAGDIRRIHVLGGEAAVSQGLLDALPHVA